MKCKVYIIKCPDYEQAQDKLNILLSGMGGMEKYIQHGSNVLIKPNLLDAALPEKAKTTHPAVISAIGKNIEKAGGIITIADSPGSGMPYDKKNLEKCYTRCGLYEITKKNNWNLSMSTEYREISYKNGSIIKRFEIISPALDADSIINVCKFKTHVFMHMTGAVKNMFGIIPGLKKPGYHSKLRNKNYFARMLLDLVQCIPPQLSIMDAVIGMEGNGPSGGSPKQMGYLIASENPLGIDVVAGVIAGLNRKDNFVLAEAEKMGLTPFSPDHIDLIGADFSEIKCRNFQLPTTLLKKSGIAFIDWLSPVIKNILSLKPKIIKQRCIACESCKRACPEHAISIKNNTYAEINQNKCIRCYCCHEMCPEKAVQLNRGVLYQLFCR